MRIEALGEDADRDDGLPRGAERAGDLLGAGPWRADESREMRTDPPPGGGHPALEAWLRRGTSVRTTWLSRTREGGGRGPLEGAREPPADRIMECPTWGSSEHRVASLGSGLVAVDGPRGRSIGSSRELPVHEPRSRSCSGHPRRMHFSSDRRAAGASRLVSRDIRTDATRKRSGDRHRLIEAAIPICGRSTCLLTGVPGRDPRSRRPDQAVARQRIASKLVRPYLRHRLSVPRPERPSWAPPIPAGRFPPIWMKGCAGSDARSC